VIGDKINLLVEIVSAVNLPKADVGGTSDPYCVVKMKGSEIHRTKVIKQNLQPIWTLETGSMFCILSTPEEFFASSSGISFTIIDHDIAGSDDVLATVSVPLNVALESKGERTEYSMTLDKAFAKKGTKSPSLFLRIKPASQDDIEV
jgi:Ca2+-dependent lipid-binding protein